MVTIAPDAEVKILLSELSVNVQAIVRRINSVKNSKEDLETLVSALELSKDTLSKVINLL